MIDATDNGNFTSRSLLDDRPIRTLDEDYLWGPESRFREELDRIARTVVGVLILPGGISHSMTFAIYGKWGMGKSSALGLIEGSAAAFATEFECADRLLSCTYNAPIYEAMHEASRGQMTPAFDVRSTLGLKILRGMLGQTRDELLDEILANAGLRQEFADAYLVDGSKGSIGVNRALQALHDKIGGLIEYDEVVSELLMNYRSGGETVSTDGRQAEGSDGRTRAMMVFVDDLDRCSPDFTWEVLNAIQQWSRVGNLFFVLAADKEHLINAMGVRTPEQPGSEFSLEKYIQHAISVPTLRGDTIREFLKHIADADDDMADVARAVLPNSELLERGLQNRTPRSVKRALNHVSARLPLAERRAEMEPRDLARNIKESLLGYSWPVFHDSLYVAAQRDAHSPAALAFISLEQVCTEFAADPSDLERLSFELGRLAAKTNRVQMATLTPELCLFLGTRPYLVLAPASDQETEAGTTGRSESKPGIFSGRISEYIKDTQFDVIEKLRQFEFRIDAAEYDKDHNRVQATARETLEFVRENYEFIAATDPATGARVVGDVAAPAARTFKQGDNIQTILALYEQALNLGGIPSVEANNTLNLITFILNEEIVQLYDVLAQLFEKLETPPLDQHKPERRIAQKARWLGTYGDGQAPATIDMAPIMADFESDPGSREKWLTVMQLAITLKDYETMKNVCRLNYEALQNADEAFSTLRVLADSVFASNNRTDENLAAELFEFILRRTPCASALSGEQVLDTLFNQAVALYALDYDDVAGKLMFLCYRERPEQENVRSVYGRYLARARRPDLAVRVSNGEPLAQDEMVLIPSEKEMPATFVGPDVERWWENKGYFQEPCREFYEQDFLKLDGRPIIQF